MFKGAALLVLDDDVELFHLKGLLWSLTLWLWDEVSEAHRASIGVETGTERSSKSLHIILM